MLVGQHFFAAVGGDKRQPLQCQRGMTAGNGYFQKEIAELFRGMGYQLNMGVLNAADYGVPQTETIGSAPLPAR